MFKFQVDSTILFLVIMYTDTHRHTHTHTQTDTKTETKARRTQTNNAQLYLAELYTVHNQIAYATNNAEPLCAGVW